MLDKRTAVDATDANALTRLLADLLPHIQTDDCPVCERDFSEYSSEPLKSHVSNRITALTASVRRLEMLANKRAEALRRLAEAEHQRAEITARQISVTARDELRKRQDRLKQLNKELIAISQEAAIGEQKIVARKGSVSSAK